MAYERRYDPKNGLARLNDYMGGLPARLATSPAEERAEVWQEVAEAALRVAQGGAFYLQICDDDIAQDDWYAALPDGALRYNRGRRRLRLRSYGRALSF